MSKPCFNKLDLLGAEVMFCIDCTANKESPWSAGGERWRHGDRVCVSGLTFHKTEMSSEVWEHPVVIFTKEIVGNMSQNPGYGYINGFF